jgi:hypothetical protein
MSFLSIKYIKQGEKKQNNVFQSDSKRYCVTLFNANCAVLPLPKITCQSISLWSDPYVVNDIGSSKVAESQRIIYYIYAKNLKNAFF